MIGAARANFFPKVTYSACGTRNASFRLLSGFNLFGGIGPTIDFPLSGAGLPPDEVEIDKAQFTQAAENYRAAVLRALKEGQDGLSSSRWLAEEYNQSTTAAVAAGRPPTYP